jgi:enoyl-CoA hydratase/carnithine racemase
VTTREQLDETAYGIAREIRDNAPLAVQSIKRTINTFADNGLAEALRFEAMSASVEFVSEDMPKGYAAKAAKQPVQFEGK